MYFFAVLLLALGANGFAAPGIRANVRVAPAVRMIVDGSCEEVARTPLGSTYACDSPQGLGQEIENINGQMKYVRYPERAKATMKDAVDNACNFVSNMGSRQVCTHLRRVPLRLHTTSRWASDVCRCGRARSAPPTA